MEPEHGIVDIGYCGAYAQAAAKALLDNTDLTAAESVKRSLTIACELSTYTNLNHTLESLP